MKTYDSVRDCVYLYLIMLLALCFTDLIHNIFTPRVYPSRQKNIRNPPCVLLLPGLRMKERVIFCKYCGVQPQKNRGKIELFEVGLPPEYSIIDSSVAIREGKGV